MTTGMTLVLVIGLVAAFWLAAAGMWTWLGRLRADRPVGRHRATGVGFTPPPDDAPPLPRPTRQELRRAMREIR